MSTSLVIVAIPEEQDRVWKISSEKVPHLTLLHLGDVGQVQNLDQIMQFVDHAVTLSEHGPFYLDIDHRGTLGEKEADVVFFNKRSWNLKWIRQFRGQLLQNQAVRTAFDATEQILEAPQEWLPHLTLGYPDKPAKKLSDNGFEGDHLYSIRFDRIAVWAEEYNGPEFRLEWPERELEGDLAIAYSDQQKMALMHNGVLGPRPMTTPELGEQFLEHYGKKGMKWGVRTDRQGRDRFSPEGHSLEGDLARLALFPTPLNYAAAWRLGKRYGQHANEQQWKKGLTSAKKGVEVHNKAAEEINRKLPGFNGDKRWKNSDGSDINLNKNAEKMNEYNRAFEREVMNPAYANASVAVHGSQSPHGRYKFEIQDASTGLMQVTDTRKVEHAATDDDVDVVIPLKILRETNGVVVGFEWPEVAMTKPAEDDGMKQTAALGEEFLAHYGVKGMKWGVRNTSRSTSKPGGLFSREAPKAVDAKATSKVPHGSRRKTKIETEGGENHPAHDDAITVAKSVVKLKKSGTKALSNKELQDVTNRIRLEEQATQATRSAGSKWVRKFLGGQGNQVANQVVRTEVDSRIRGLHNK